MICIPANVQEGHFDGGENKSLQTYRYKKNFIYRSSCLVKKVLELNSRMRNASSNSSIPRNTMHRSRKAGKKCCME